MSFTIKDYDVLDKYNEIWDKIEETLSIKFYTTPVYDEKYIKTKVREFSGVIKTNLLEDEVPKNEHYTCIACITIDSFMRIEKKNYLQVLEECKYRVKKTKMTKFIEAELESKSESELESDIELELRSELKSDT